MDHMPGMAGHHTHGGAQPHNGTGHHHDSGQGEPEQHAFIMLGEETLFLCHMTMFHMEEHMYQVVLRASLPDDARRRYRADRREHPGEPYFLGNVVDDRLWIPDFQVGGRTEFLADIWRGIPQHKEYHAWPWKEQRPLLHNVRVTVERVVYYRHFDFNLEYPRSLTYVLFGAGDEAHLTHYQVKEPDFDHVLSLARAPHWLSGKLLEAGVHVNFPEFTSPPPYCSDPLTKKHHKVQCHGMGELHPIEIGNSYWFSTKILNLKDPCAASTTGSSKSTRGGRSTAPASAVTGDSNG